MVRLFLLLAVSGMMGMGIPLAVSASSEHGRVAVIDLDQVARATGRGRDITQEVAKLTEAKEKDLHRLRDQLRQSLDHKKEKLGNKPSKEDQDKFAQETAEAEQQLRQELEKAREATEVLRQRLLQEFQDEVRPIARREAQKKGLDVVMTKNSTLLFVEPAVDITEEVIDNFSTRSEPKGVPEEKAKPSSEKKK